MNAILSSAAWVIHDLGLASLFGGSLFGKVALEPAVEHISNPQERALVIDDAWRRFSLIKTVSLISVGATWLIGRNMLSGREVSKNARVMTIVKDALIGGTIASGLAGIIVGRFAGVKARQGQLPLGSSGEPLPGAAPEATAATKAVDVLGGVSSVLQAGVLGVTALLAMQSAKSPRFSLVSRILP